MEDEDDGGRFKIVGREGESKAEQELHIIIVTDTVHS